jgi:hypothetical protein
MSESTATLYDTDFYAWAQQQAEHLRAKRITKLDGVLAWACPRARRTAAKQTGLPLLTFPAECEWVFIRLMNEDLWV